MRMTPPKLFPLLLFVLFATHAHAQSQPSAQIQWRPLVYSSSVNTDQIFPAEILALAARPITNGRATYLGDPNGVFGIEITSAIPNVRVEVSITVDQLAQASTFEAVIPQASRAYEVWPKVRFDMKALSQARQPFPTTVVFALSVDGVPSGQQSRTIQVRSVNDVPFAYMTTKGQVLDSGYMFAAFVNENSSAIDAILKEALSVNAVQRFAGYQGSAQDVIREVFAIWNVLQRHGVKYSNITTPSGQSKSVFSQHVRFVEDVIASDQANCADGSVLFASVLYKLGILPALVMIPGHMFVGFFVDQQKKQPLFLETTMIGNPGLNRMQRGWRFMTGDGYLASESYQQFQQALARGNEQFQQAIPNFKAKHPHFRLIDIDAARRLGVAAIPRF